jgi:hypothetical protein
MLTQLEITAFVHQGAEMSLVPLSGAAPDNPKTRKVDKHIR